MSAHSLALTPPLLAYLQTHSVHEPDLLKALREETVATFEAASMQISPEQGQFFRFFLEMMQAKNVLEIGTFTGYSSICMALALPENGRVICCDSSFDWTRLAVKYWEKMHLTQKIILELAPAIKTLEKLLQEKKHNIFDFAFIDADKINYMRYYEYCLQLVRTGGVIAIDNVLWNGEVMNAANQDENTRVIRELNDLVYRDSRVTACMLPIGDGLTLVVKK